MSCQKGEVMTRKTNKKDIRSANLSEQQKQVAINKIDRMLKSLSIFDVKTIIERSDSRIRVLADNLDKLLVDIFDHDTVDYERYSHIKHLDTESIFLGPDHIDMGRVRQAIKGSVKLAIDTLSSIKQGFVDDLQDTELDKPSRILKAYNGLELHSVIAKVSNDLYKNGHYADAVEAAAKRLVNYVKEKSIIKDKDGSSLMQHVFSPNNPILKFNSLQTQSDKDEQQGYMHLFTGAVMGIRNPRAHENIVDDPEEALEYIAFISLLAKRLDKTIK